ncbi:MAG: hypothetical protein RMK84_14340 [Oscillochloridaceae bacterium]|nr:hypothetical protein [Chloroflexaceae bacterium]MDW8391301.1 hypothetical protein [Oscillochloridaceae bacterium]
MYTAYFSLTDLLLAALNALVTPLGLLLLGVMLFVLLQPARRPTPTVVYVPMETEREESRGSGCLALLALALLLMLALALFG